MTSTVTCSRILQFFSTLPRISIPHATLLVGAAEAFFAGRMWTASPASSRMSRTAPAVRAARLVCSQLATAQRDFLLAPLCLRVVRAVAAALLVAPEEAVGTLSDALAAGVLASAAGGDPLAWVSDEEMHVMGEALSALLHNWVPCSTARAVEQLVETLRGITPASDGGWGWAQTAFDAANDFREGLTTTGLDGSALCSSAGEVPFRSLRDLRRTSQRASAVATPVAAPRQTMAASGPAWELVQDATGETTSLPEGREIVIGRRPTCDVVVPATAVSGKHCVIVSSGGRVELRDCGGTNGTFVNDVRQMPGTQVELRQGDAVSLASRIGPRFLLLSSAASGGLGTRARPWSVCGDSVPESRAPDPPRLVPAAPPTGTVSSTTTSKLPGKACEDGPAKASELSTEEVAVAVAAACREPAATPRFVSLVTGCVHRLPHKGILSLGRKGDNELVVASSLVSSRHCVLFCRDGYVEVEDVSANGTFVNDTRLPKGFSLPQRVALRHGDRVALAHLRGPAFLFIAPDACESGGA